MLTSMVKEHHKEQAKRKQEQGIKKQLLVIRKYAIIPYPRGAKERGHRSLQ